MENILVSDVMTRGHILSNVNDSLIDCARKMVRKKVGGLIITDKKKLVGFISGQDILWALVKNPKIDLSSVKATDISPKKIITIGSSAKVKEAIEKMKKHGFYRLPVVDKNTVVGMITARDILSFYPNAYAELRELESIREEQEKIKRVNERDTESVPIEGICEECGSMGELYRVDGSLLCESCMHS